mmetsp:Transcript_15241/g.49655  ORF Transcript_15241/g.49655 Transcript_15241/m.49655 type:complete len:90 (-) Transcript_15241:6152-6421(-)
MRSNAKSEVQLEEEKKVLNKRANQLGTTNGTAEDIRQEGDGNRQFKTNSPSRNRNGDIVRTIPLDTWHRRIGHYTINFLDAAYNDEGRW